MDIFLSPNRPFRRSSGSFDGFSLGSHAQFCGVTLLVTDELSLNDIYSDDEIEIIKPNVIDIVQKVEKYFLDLELLYQLWAKGKEKCHTVWNDTMAQEEYTSFFSAILDGENTERSHAPAPQDLNSAELP